MEYKDYYKVLGVDKNDSHEKIRNRYRELAKRYHPDLNPNDSQAQEKFKEINEAYEVLGDEDKRKRYDTFGSGHNFTDGQHFDPSQYGFGDFGNGYSYTYTTEGAEGFSDFFNMFFGGGKGFDMSDLFGGQQGRARRAAAQTYESELDITLEEGYRGATRTISLRIGSDTKSISVKVPKGILPGKRIKIKGSKMGIGGDVYLKVNFVLKDNVELKGLDIYKDIDIFPWDAALGTRVVVDTLDGRIKVTIPENMKAGGRIRVPGKGYRDMKGKRGDMYIRANMINPSDLTGKQKELYRQLRDSI
ncbi:MAG: DnaJ domain-containing protein [Tissierellia bacterium]|nr:DnaJ domain-containing protein [Tissierellia bacterium]